MANFNFKPVTNERAPNDTKSGVSSSSNSKFTFTPVVDKTPAQPAPKPTIGGRILNAAEWLTAPIVKPFAEVATNAVNAVQIATGKKETQPFSGKYLGDVKGLGKLDVTQGLTPENVATFKKSVGTGAEIASTIGGGGVVKDALGNVVKPTLKRLALEGAGLNATYGAGQSLSENQGLSDTLKNTATQGAIGGILGPVLGLAERGVSKLLSKETKNIISEEADNIFNETQNKGEAQKNISETEVLNTPIEQQTPEFKAKVEEISNNIRQDTTTDFEHQTNQQQIAHVLSKDPSEVVSVALGKKAPEGGIPDTAYLAVAQNMADKLATEGDFSLVNKLSQSDIGRKAGQTLQALQIAMKNSVTGIVRDIRTSLEDKLPKSISKFADKEKQNIRENISKVIDTIDITKSSREDILLAVEKLMCK